MNYADYLVVTSGVRNNSNSTRLAMEVGKGIEETGASVELLNLAGLKINGCIGCMGCVSKEGRESKGCVQHDDMQAIYPKVVAAKGIVYASPIYWFNMNGQLKTFIDRCFAVAVTGGCSQKRYGGVFVYGDTDPLNSGCVNAVRSLQDIANYTKSTWVGAVYGTANDPGEMDKNVELLEKAHALGTLMASN